MNTVSHRNAVDRRNVHMSLRVNGEEVDVSFAPYKTLLEVLREDLDLTGTKHGCELGECGAFAVLVDGEPVLSCLLLAVECEGRSVETVESLARGPGLHPLQAAFRAHHALQCGFCTPGALLAVYEFLTERKNVSDEEIRVALSGVLCRCTGYNGMVDAVRAADREWKR